MEKEALLKIILRDIKELELLVTTFISEDSISDGYIQLAKNKTQAVLDELNLISESKRTRVVRHIEEAKVLKQESPITKSEKEEKVDEVVKIEEVQPEIKPAVTKEVEVTPPPTPKSETPKTTFVKKEGKSLPKSVIGEVLGKENKSLNEQLFTNNTSGEASFQTPISDLKKAIGINDRFFFQRELFESKAEVFDQVVAQINAMQDYDSAITFIKGNFSWNFEEEAAATFLELVKRRFKTK